MSEQDNIPYFRLALTNKYSWLTLLVVGGVLNTILPIYTAVSCGIIAQVVLAATFASNERFKRIVRADYLIQAALKKRKVMEGKLMRMNQSKHRDKYLEVRSQINKVNQYLMNNDRTAKATASARSGMAQIESKILDLVVLLVTLEQSFTPAKKAEIEKAASGDSNVSLHKERLLNFEMAQDKVEQAAKQLDYFQTSIQMLAEKTLGSVSSDMLKTEIDSLMVYAESTDQNLAEMNRMMNLSMQPFGEAAIMDASSKIREL